MPNKSYALEWLEFAAKNLETAKILYREKHYNDIIAIEIHQAIEKTMKALLAYEGIRIPKTHSLIELRDSCVNYLKLNFDIDNMLLIEDYYDTERYPGPRYSIPSNSEIEKNISVAEQIYRDVNKYIEL
ncbi:HEPN domain-containing protein [Bacteroidota bacterium]